MNITEKYPNISAEVAEQLQAIADNEPKIYDKGKTEGIEQGKQAEYDMMWDHLQDYGKRLHYANAFAYAGWDDTNYNPKHPINPSNKNGLNSMFFWNQKITDTKVDIKAFGNCNSAFANCIKLVRIHKLIFDGITSADNMFQNATALVELNCEGVIELSLNFQWSPLSPASMKSVISCLANCSGTDKAYTNSIIFNDDCWAALEADSAAPDGGSWKLYVDSLGWLT